jgi:hypothetical protein
MTLDIPLGRATAATSRNLAALGRVDELFDDNPHGNEEYRYDV